MFEETNWAGSKGKEVSDIFQYSIRLDWHAVFSAPRAAHEPSTSEMVDFFAAQYEVNLIPHPFVIEEWALDVKVGDTVYLVSHIGTQFSKQVTRFAVHL